MVEFDVHHVDYHILRGNCGSRDGSLPVMVSLEWSGERRGRPPVPPPRKKKLAKLAASGVKKKTALRGPESWVVVRNIRSESGGILDPDDRVRDVADDRETLTADTGAGPPPGPLGPPPRALHHAGGDGASAGSSVGTASPDIFRGGGSGRAGGGGRGGGGDAGCGVEVGAADGAAGLQVRRGSEPNLQDVMPTQNSMTQMPDHTKRWSAAVVCRDDKSHIHKSVADGHSPDPHPSMDSNRLNPNTAQPFQRQTNRLSMQFSGPGSGVWMDAAERVAQQSSNTKSLPRDSARKDPLGQDTSTNASTNTNNQNHRVEDMLRWVSGVNGTATSPSGIQERQLDLLPEVNGVGREVSGAVLEVPVLAGTLGRSSGHSGHSGHCERATVSLLKGEKGLGFTITTRDNPTGGVCPIYIKNILPKGAAVLDGRLHAGDKLVSVNGVSVWGLSQQQVVSLLRNTPTHSTVTIVVERPASAHSTRTQHTNVNSSPQKYKENAVGSPNNNILMNGNLNKSLENGKVSSIVNSINQGQQSSSQVQVGSGRHIKKSASNNDLQQKLNSSSDSLLQNALNSPNTVVGLRNRLIMRLDVPVYDSEKAGLGISVKGKVTVGEHPQDLGIFIKSVLNGGAASRDGRLHKNDQLLNVNGVSLEQQSNAEAMEALRKALLHTPSAVRGSITLTIARRTDSCDSLARWKNDTPPSDQSNENSNTHSFSGNNNTVIYNHGQQKSLETVHRNSIHSEKSYEATKSNSNMNNSQTKKNTSIVTINNNVSWVNNQSDDSKGYLERDNCVYNTEPNKRDSFEWSRLDGWNPVLDRLTGLRNESYYIATQEEKAALNGHRDIPRTHQMAHLMQRSPPSHHNVIIEEDYGTVKAPTPNGGGPWESGSESVGEGSAGDAAFSRDAVGRRSMSEKRHAAMDAKATGTYKKLKEQRTANAVQVGPSLGMRKSSSLESLQTAMQEMSMHQQRPRAHQPLKHWLTDGPGALEGAMVRGSPQQSSLSHKKPGLLKSISSMLRFGHKRPKGPDGSEIYGRTQPHRSSEKSLSREAIERINAPKHTSDDRVSDRLRGDGHYSVSHSRQASGERSAGDRLPGERSPGDRLPRERLPGDRLPDPGDAQQSRQNWAAPPYRLPPARTSPSSHTMSQVMEGAWGGTHYVNYEEIQQNLNARREKLSEVQIGQMRRQVHAQRVKADQESRRVGLGGVSACSGGGGYHSQRGRSEHTTAARPTSNYYEYETIQHARPVNAKVTTYH